jgi:hypothetical protein
MSRRTLLLFPVAFVTGLAGPFIAVALDFGTPARWGFCVALLGLVVVVGLPLTLGREAPPSTKTRLPG